MKKRRLQRRVNNLIDFKERVAFAIAMYQLANYSMDELVDWLTNDEELTKMINKQIDIEKNKKINKINE